jgi:hypothetical protein
MTDTRCYSTKRSCQIPLVDVYADAGTFADKHRLAALLARALMTIEQVPDIPMVRKSTAAFVHELPNGSISNVDGDSNYDRAQVLTNAAALDREKQLAVVEQFTAIVANAAGDRMAKPRRVVPVLLAPNCRSSSINSVSRREDVVPALLSHPVRRKNAP